MITYHDIYWYRFFIALMDIFSIIMIIILPLFIKQEFRGIITGALINIVYRMQYEELMIQNINLYERYFQIFFAIGLIVLFLLNWFGDNVLSGQYIDVVLTLIIIIVIAIQKLILIMINIVYSFTIYLLSIHNGNRFAWPYRY